VAEGLHGNLTCGVCADEHLLCSIRNKEWRIFGEFFILSFHEYDWTR